MKKLFTSIGILAITLAIGTPCATARDISSQEALRTAKDFVKSRPLTRSLQGEVTLAFAQPSATSNANCFYVYNIGREGFVIIAGDSGARPVLGYSDKGAFDAKTMPANVRWWLSQYQEEIDAFRGRSVAPARTRTGAEDISPLLSSEWNQTEPYNNLCPSLPNNDGAYKHAYTGCVATAMAQIMNYHQWPKGPGMGEHTDFFVESASYDFTKLNIDWKALELATPRVFTSSPEAARKAVAELMLAVGVSVDMNYQSKDGSGAWTFCAPAAYITNFGYSTAIDYKQRNGFTDTQWDAMLLSELSAQRPILYAGYNSSGHAFVCDGYDGDGMFHFNWGWGGSYDGYFATNAMFPTGGGAGAGDYTTGYNKNQEIVIGIQPPVTGEEAATHTFISTSTLEFQGLDTNTLPRSVFKFADGGIKFYWPYGGKILFAFGVWEKDTKKFLGYTGGTDVAKLAFETSYVNFGYGYAIKYDREGRGPLWDATFGVIASVIPTLGDGDYILRPVSRINASNDKETPINHRYHPMFAANRDAIVPQVLTVKNGENYFRAISYQEDEDTNGVTFPMGMNIDRKQASMKPEETIQLNVSVFPTIENVPLSWSTGDEAIATVDKNGVVTGIAEGTTDIRVATADGSALEAVCTITVSKDASIGGTEADQNITVQGASDTITLNGVAEGSVIEVYNVAGLRVASKKAVAGTNEIRLGECRGIYVVRVGNYQTKVRL